MNRGALRRLAEHPATPEAERRIAARLLEEVGPPEEPASANVAWKDAFDRELVAHVAAHCGLEVARTGRRRADGKGIRYADSYQLTGPKRDVEAAVTMIATLRPQLFSGLQGFVAGWLAHKAPIRTDRAGKGQEVWLEESAVVAGILSAKEEEDAAASEKCPGNGDARPNWAPTGANGEKSGSPLQQSLAITPDSSEGGFRCTT